MTYLLPLFAAPAIMSLLDPATLIDFLYLSQSVRVGLWVMCLAVLLLVWLSLVALIATVFLHTLPTNPRRPERETSSVSSREIASDLGRNEEDQRSPHPEGPCLEPGGLESSRPCAYMSFLPDTNCSPVSFVPARRTLPPIVDSNVLLDLLVSQYLCSEGDKRKVSAASGKWELGFASLKGNVRTENQDYCIGYTYGEYQIAIAADGLGGLTYGREASFIASWVATLSAIGTLSVLSQNYIFNPERVAAEAVRAASLSLAAEGDKMNVFTEGLRTTLIVVVTSPFIIGYSYIGDGGGCVVRRFGDTIHFLVPQKAYKGIPNILAASLGPSIQGAPVTGSIVRAPGDLIVIGTDGVFDRLEDRIDSFPEGTDRFLAELRKATIDHRGDFQAVVNRVLREMADFRDASGYVCDDNLTLAMLGDGKGPVASKSESELHEADSLPLSTGNSPDKAEV